MLLGRPIASAALSLGTLRVRSGSVAGWVGSCSSSTPPSLGSRRYPDTPILAASQGGGLLAGLRGGCDAGGYSHELHADSRTAAEGSPARAAAEANLEAYGFCLLTVCTLVTICRSMIGIATDECGVSEQEALAR